MRTIRHSEASIICSADDDVGPNAFLRELSKNAVENAWDNDLSAFAQSKAGLPDSVYYQVFPGEHYRLLHSLVRVLSPASIIEIGTFTGMSSAVMAAGMVAHCKITTFDLTSWRQFDSHLTENDFASGRITQVLDDLSAPERFSKHIDLFSSANLIFCDAPKDGVFENKFLANLTSIQPKSNCLLVLDDTRLLNMIDVWRSIRSPKLDLTSFGHWAGTGLVDMTGGLQLR